MIHVLVTMMREPTEDDTCTIYNDVVVNTEGFFFQLSSFIKIGQYLQDALLTMILRENTEDNTYNIDNDVRDY